MSDTDLKAWFAIASTQGLGPARLQPVIQSLHSRRAGASSLIGADPADLTRVGLSGALARQVSESLAHPAAPPPTPEGTALLHPDDERYPLQRALHGTPPLPALLYAAGDMTLLGRTPSIAIVGSRHASPSVLDASREAATVAAQLGWVVVSGLARGVDEAAHVGTVEKGGAAIAVLAEGLLRSERAQQILHNPTGDVAIVSEFAPSDSWTPGRAMQRNGTVAALADAVFVVASDERGGTWEMGQLCLKRGKQLMVLELSGLNAPGNRRLIRAGAAAIQHEHLSATLESYLVPPADPPNRHEQQTLDI